MLAMPNGAKRRRYFGLLKFQSSVAQTKFWSKTSTVPAAKFVANRKLPSLLAPKATPLSTHPFEESLTTRAAVDRPAVGSTAGFPDRNHCVQPEARWRTAPLWPARVELADRSLTRSRPFRRSQITQKGRGSRQHNQTRQPRVQTDQWPPGNKSAMVLAADQ